MKKNMFLRTILIFPLVLLLQKTYAQDAFSMATDFIQDGAPKYAKSEGHYGDLEGTPYFYDGWAKGIARLSDGKAYKNLLLKYDEIQGLVIFKYAETDSAMAFAVPAVEFEFSFITDNKINTAHFLNGFDPIGDGTKTTYYQVLSNGDTKVLKRTTKKILKRTEFNSTELIRRVEDDDTYYLAKGMHPVKVKNDNKSVLTVLNDKAALLKQYIADNKLNAKNDEDFGKIVDYYNSK